jgi:hypothetical protein
MKSVIVDLPLYRPSTVETSTDGQLRILVNRDNLFAGMPAPHLDFQRRKAPGLTNMFRVDTLRHNFFCRSYRIGRLQGPFFFLKMSVRKEIRTRTLDPPGRRSRGETGGEEVPTRPAA